MHKGYISEKMRRVPVAYPNESLMRGAERMRESGVAALPIVQGGIPIGLLTEARLRVTLQDPEIAMNAVHEWMETDFETIPLDAPIEQAVHQLQQTQQPLLIVVDTLGGYAGVLAASDVLSRVQTALRPPQVGGMATPLGVYLTTGTLRAGPGDFALFLTGILLFTLFTVSGWLVVSSTLWVQAKTDIPLHSYLISPFGGTFLLSDWMGILLRASGVLLFLGLMRALPLAGTHAAEHKVVHAIERGEPLILEVVRRMPRIHPRCGTNLAAGVFLFIGLVEVFQWLMPGSEGQQMSLLFALLLTVLFWRMFGALLQWAATTKPPTDKQILGAIRSGEELLSQYRRRAYTQVSFGKRLWNIGLLQIIAGGWFAIAMTLLLEEWLGITILIR
jgi:CBS domain-containing protein